MNSIFIRTLLWNDPSDLCMLLYLYNAYVSRYEDRLRRMFDLRHKPDDLGIFLFFFFKFQSRRIYFSMELLVYPYLILLQIIINRSKNLSDITNGLRSILYITRFKRFEVDREAVDRRRLETS